MPTSLTPTEQAERALNFLATTDLEVAEWRVSVLRTEYLADVAEAMAFKLAEGTVEDRKREAKTVDAVRMAKEEYFKAVKHWETLRARRKRAELTIEMWRTIESSRRMGAMA